MDISQLAQIAQRADRPETGVAQATDTNQQVGFTSQDADAITEDFDTFLTLLTAQISNQDPLAPADSTQFVEQLATFSNLELQATNNKILEGIATLLEQYVAGAPTA
ncbi:MAG: flagellar hook capping FlgD N-terminal domain-containing protein [Litorimonas sp.]